MPGVPASNWTLAGVEKACAKGANECRVNQVPPLKWPLEGSKVKNSTVLTKNQATSPAKFGDYLPTPLRGFAPFVTSAATTLKALPP